MTTPATADHVMPAFEGRVVAGSSVKLSGALPASELDGQVLGVDDVVYMFATFRCIGVRHTVNEKSGEIIREHTLRPVEMVLAPTDPNDPESAFLRILPLASRTVVAKEDGE